MLIIMLCGERRHRLVVHTYHLEIMKNGRVNGLAEDPVFCDLERSRRSEHAALIMWFL